MITLTINRINEDECLFSIPAPDGTIISASSIITPRTRDTIIEPFRKAATRQAGLGNCFRSAGRMLFSLFPDELQSFLEDHRTESILIQTNDCSIPWELVHDNNNYQGLTRPIGRSLILKDFFKWSSREVMEPPEKPSVLIVANPGRENPEMDLPEADREAEALLEFFTRQGCTVHLLAGRSATMFEVITHLQGDHGPYDIIHYAGHAVLEKTGCRKVASLVLADGNLAPNDIRRFIHGSPVVFLNACHTVVSQQIEQGTDRYDSRSPYAAGSSSSMNLAEAFIMGNKKGYARTLIGTLFRNDDTRSRELALSFYRSLLEGSTFGESLCAAREKIYSDDDITWASYVLYGLPDQKLRPRKPTVPGIDIRNGDTTQGEGGDTDEPETGQPGEFSAEMLGDTAREALLNALQVGGDSEFRKIITPSLFLGMADIGDGYTRKFLRNGPHPPETILKLFSKALREADSETRKGGSRNDVTGVSDRIGHIFSLAREYATLDGGDENCLIEEKHLLQAFFEDGGGITASILTTFGLRLPNSDRKSILALDLFQDTKKKRAKEPPPEQEPTPNDDPRLAPSGTRAIEAAFAEARAGGQPVLTTPHLLLGIMTVDRDGFVRLVQQSGVRPEVLKQTLRSVLPKGDSHDIDHVAFTPRFHGILGRAVELAEKDRGAGARHLAMAVIQDGLQDTDSITLKILRHCGLDPEELLAALEAGSSPGPGSHQAGVRIAAKTDPAKKDRPENRAASATPVLDELGRDLVLLAAEDRLPEVVGREDEINALVEVLLRKSKACPVLIGEAGVGKTAIVEGFARLVAGGRAPGALAGIRLIEISISSLVAGTRYRGDFEDRLQALLEEVKMSGNIILFFDELHTMIGAGGSGEGAMHAGDILKPALARGELKCIGATTSDEYRRWIESDSALERRFSPVMVEEPSLEETLAILRGIRPSYEKHHGVNIPDETLEAVVRLSCDALAHRRLPDKAIDLLDQACARTRRLLAADCDASSSRPRVTPDQVEEVLAVLTGVPVSGGMDGERSSLSERMRQLAGDLAREVMGQQQAIDALVRAVAVIETGMRETQKPGAVLFFTGPVGVGKSSLAGAFARLQERPLVRLDMGEYTEPHQVAKLIGSPPGYIGHGREGYLTGKLRSAPRCVVLLDEVEKAHPDILRLFLRLFDEGWITDAKGRTVDGRKAIFIMTSNLGSSGQPGSASRPMGFTARTTAKSGPVITVDKELLKKRLAPELVDRIDSIIVFQPLDQEAMQEITRHLLTGIERRFKERHGLELRISGETVTFIADRGGKEHGVRPLQRVIEDSLTSPLAQGIVDGKWPKGAVVDVLVEDGKIVFREHKRS